MSQITSCQNRKIAFNRYKRRGFFRRKFLFFLQLKLLGIPFVITKYRKGGFLVIFRDRSLVVCPIQLRSRSRKIIKKYALFGATHFCGEEIAACGAVFARQTTETVCIR